VISNGLILGREKSEMNFLAAGEEKDGKKTTTATKHSS